MTLDCHLPEFREVWLCDFEFCAPTGERPQPLCLVAREWRTGRTLRLWQDELAELPAPPFSVGKDALFVAYYASAELGCFLALDWPMPVRVLDLFAEFRCLTSGLAVPCGSGLLGALSYFGLDGLAAAEKGALRQLALRGGPYTQTEQADLLAYCETDVDSLAKLLTAKLPTLDLPRALLRGRYMAAAARMEWTGAPIDTEALATLRGNWSRLKTRLVETVDRDYGVYVPTHRPRIDPETALGQGITATAIEHRVDPYPLADAVDELWRREREAAAESRAAVQAARRATGLTSRRLELWENSGRDAATWPSLDTAAKELADSHPALGIGTGYDPGSPDEDDVAGRIWERLRNADPPLPTKVDLLPQAANLVQGQTRYAAGNLSFSAARFANYLSRTGIPWPQLETGALDLADNTFREMARAYPSQIGPLRELRHAISQLRLNELAVGADGRNRCLLSAFGARTGRNQPSNARFIFGPSTWLRGLLRPAPGMALAYVDWEQQEFAIAAALSRDVAMLDAYHSEDPYLSFAKQVGAVPASGTKESHKAERERFKTLALAVQYGMGADSLARRLNQSPAHGRELIDLHKRTYPRYWAWSDAVEMTAYLSGRLQATFGWTVQVGPDANPRSLRNFPLQANGAEMLRLACILTTERGIRVCAPVHDALLVEAPAADIVDVVVETQRAMREASELVLPGFPLRTEAKIVRWPDRYSDPRGERFWETVWGLVDPNDGTPTEHGMVPERSMFGTPTKHTGPLLFTSSVT